MLPQWLNIVSVLSLGVSVLCALVVVGDMALGNRQKMAIMNIVWPLTPLYFGPLGLWAYYAFGRQKKEKQDEQKQDDNHKDEKPFWQTVFVGTSHCGAGCTLGDFIGEWAVFLFGWTIAGIALWPAFIADFTCAFLIGVVFQYFSIVPMRNLKPLPGIWAAIKADTLSITAFEVGMFAWMALQRFVLIGHELKPTQAAYWFLMQIAMILGFATSYPMNWWLIKKGLKEKM